MEKLMTRLYEDPDLRDKITLWIGVYSVVGGVLICAMITYAKLTTP